MTNIYLNETNISNRTVKRSLIADNIDNYYTAIEVAKVFGKTKQTIHQAILKEIFDTAKCYSVTKYNSWFVEKAEVDKLALAVDNMPESEKSGQKFTRLLLEAKSQ